MLTAKEIEINTANAWIKSGAIKVTEYGDENTYYSDQFGNTFFCKNYPQLWGTVNASPNPNQSNG